MTAVTVLLWVISTLILRCLLVNGFRLGVFDPFLDERADRNIKVIGLVAILFKVPSVHVNAVLPFVHPNLLRCKVSHSSRAVRYHVSNRVVLCVPRAMPTGKSAVSPCVDATRTLLTFVVGQEAAVVLTHLAHGVVKRRTKRSPEKV